MEELNLFEKMGDWKRTSYCGELTAADIGKNACLMGWVQRRRDHGGLIFIDLRDRAGIMQLVFSPESQGNEHEAAHGLRSELGVAVQGSVVGRPEGTATPTRSTGPAALCLQERRRGTPADARRFTIEDDSDVA